MIHPDLICDCGLTKETCKAWRAWFKNDLKENIGRLFMSFSSKIVIKYTLPNFIKTHYPHYASNLDKYQILL